MENPKKRGPPRRTHTHTVTRISPIHLSPSWKETSWWPPSAPHKDKSLLTCSLPASQHQEATVQQPHRDTWRRETQAKQPLWRCRRHKLRSRSRNRSICPTGVKLVRPNEDNVVPSWMTQEVMTSLDNVVHDPETTNQNTDKFIQIHPSWLVRIKAAIKHTLFFKNKLVKCQRARQIKMADASALLHSVQKWKPPAGQMLSDVKFEFLAWVQVPSANIAGEPAGGRSRLILHFPGTCPSL